MKSFWKIYALIGVLLVAYTGLAFIATIAYRAPVILTPGEKTTMSVFSLGSGKFRLNGSFPDSGKKNWSDPSELEPVRLSITKDAGETLLFHAYRVSGKGWNPERLSRSFFAKEPDDPQKSFFPSEPYRTFPRAFGFSTFEIKVEYAHPNLEGKQITLIVAPQLGFKVTEESVAWLFWAFLAPFYFGLYLIIGLAKAFIEWRRRKKALSAA